ncbi:cytosolic fe-S cluster assembly factor NAR1 [Physcia stellaris]|nr:cytosolic fe-S cluster assembly factor NAR1 [Physcia stellaris]
MSAILSADDLNDFISPGVACIKPVETLPLQEPQKQDNAYEVTTEDKLAADSHAPAQISLTDCLACSGCVTSAEAVLVSLQSHAEVLNTLDAYPAIEPSRLQRQYVDGSTQTLDEGVGDVESEGKLFVASVSPQVRASIAATYDVSEIEAGHMIDHLLSGPNGLASGGKNGNSFTWVVDTNAMREAALLLGADEVLASLPQPPRNERSTSQPTPSTPLKTPILTSACPGWICYAEKTHPHVLPHLSRLKSPQALTGTLLKTVLSRHLHIRPDQIWHVAIMPCFDKKLEASREELTDIYWRPSSYSIPPSAHAPTRGESHSPLSHAPPSQPTSIPRPHTRLLPLPTPLPLKAPSPRPNPSSGTSGGYLSHILATHLSLHPSSTLTSARGRNADVTDYTITSADGAPLFRAARYYGFRNIQNLVRKLRPARSRMPGARAVPVKEKEKGGLEYAYVEVMACPGGCTNGGGQIKGADVSGVVGQKEWLARVDEAYFSSASGGEGEDAEWDGNAGDRRTDDDSEVINGISTRRIRTVLDHWSSSTGIPLEKLAYTSYRMVESDVGKVDRGGGQERVAELAGRIGGGW